MKMEWREGWSELLDVTAGFHDGVVHGMDLTSKSYVQTDLSMVRPGAPADVRLFVMLQNPKCPAVLIDFVNVAECSWHSQREAEDRDPETQDDELNRYFVLEFEATAAGAFWLPLDERALSWGRNAAPYHRATSYDADALVATDEAVAPGGGSDSGEKR